MEKTLLAYALVKMANDGVDRSYAQGALRAKAEQNIARRNQSGSNLLRTLSAFYGPTMDMRKALKDVPSLIETQRILGLGQRSHAFSEHGPTKDPLLTMPPLRPGHGPAPRVPVWQGPSSESALPWKMNMSPIRPGVVPNNVSGLGIVRP